MNDGRDLAAGAGGADGQDEHWDGPSALQRALGGPLARRQGAACFTKTCTTASAAREFLQRALADLQRGEDIDPRRRRTFGEYAEDWIAGATPRLDLARS